MIQHTFVHIQGIGEKTELRLWERGIRTWRDFLSWPGAVFSPGRDQAVRDILIQSLDHLDDPAFFSQRLKSAHMWRLFRRFENKAVFLDIETTCEYGGANDITVIGIYDGARVQTFVSGFNLADFEMAIAEYDLVITFNGAMFDLPVIRKAFPSITLPPAHIDLRAPLRQLGYVGGLKKIEKALGIARGADIDGLGGYEAVLLWRAWQNGDRSALDRLIAYNTADIINLKPLMELAYDRLSAEALAA